MSGERAKFQGPEQMRSSRRDPARELSRFRIAAILLAASVLLGGGGSPAVLPELLLQLVALGALMGWIAVARNEPPFRRDRLVLAGAGLLVLVPLMQLVPLPPSWWRALPGREGVVATAQLLGPEEAWRPLTVSTDRTLISFGAHPAIGHAVLRNRIASRRA